MLRSQQYSDLVFKQVEAVTAKDIKFQNKYKTLCKRAGGIFRTVGLLQFMAFIAAKGSKDSEKHYATLGEHLRKELNEVKLVKNEELEPFLEELRKAQLPEYMHISRSILEFLQWHKRISEVMISGESEEHGDEV